MSQNSETFVSWLRQLSNVLNKKLIMGDDTSCAVEFQGDITIQMAVNDATGGFYIYSVICPFPEDISDHYQLLQFILRINLEQAETLQGSFCLSDDNEHILLTFGRSIETYDANRFVNSFLKFYDVCEETKPVLQALMKT